MFANIQNGQRAKQDFVLLKRKKICEAFLKILWDEGFILGYTTDINNNKTKILLKYKNNQPVISSIKFISKPSRRIYCSAKELWKFKSSQQLTILSTNKGLKTFTNCKKLNIGGELFVTIN